MQRGKGQEVPGRQQKEEKKKAQQELQHQKENRTESVDSHLLEFITDINTLDWVKLIFFFFCTFSSVTQFGNHCITILLKKFNEHGGSEGQTEVWYMT